MRRVGFATLADQARTQEGREIVLPALARDACFDQRSLANCGSDATASAPNIRHAAMTHSAVR